MAPLPLHDANICQDDNSLTETYQKRRCSQSDSSRWSSVAMTCGIKEASMCSDFHLTITTFKTDKSLHNSLQWLWQTLFNDCVKISTFHWSNVKIPGLVALFCVPGRHVAGRVMPCWTCRGWKRLSTTGLALSPRPTSQGLQVFCRYLHFMWRLFVCENMCKHIKKFQKFGLRKDALAKVRFLRLSKAKEVLLQAWKTEGTAWHDFARLYLGAATRPWKIHGIPMCKGRE